MYMQNMKVDTNNELPPEGSKGCSTITRIYTRQILKRGELLTGMTRLNNVLAVQPSSD